MPIHITEFKVFLASPSDVAQERQAVNDAVNEVNRVWAESQNVRLSLIRWETHTSPCLGEDPQQVINTQINDDYDIFIGLLWHRIGTPTSRAISGTLEEFQRAYDRSMTDNKCKILFYFKTAPIPYDDIDPYQVAAVKKFRASIGDQGVYWWPFQDADSLRQVLRVHLSDTLRSLLPNADPLQPELSGTDCVVKKTRNEEINSDEGILDLSLRADDSLVRAHSLIQDLLRIMHDFNIRMNRHSASLQQITPSTTGGQLNKHAARTIIDSAASDMEYAASQLEIAIPELRDSVTNAFDALGEAAIISKAENTSKPEELHKIKEACDSFVEGLNEPRRIMQSLKTTIAAIPRMTTKLGHARRHLEMVIGQFDQDLGDIQSIVKSITSNLEK